MTNIEPFLKLVQTLKGAPLSCLIVLALIGHAVGNGWLEQATGYGRHAVSEALRILAGLGLVEQGLGHSGWRLAEQGEATWGTILLLSSQNLPKVEVWRDFRASGEGLRNRRLQNLSKVEETRENRALVTPENLPKSEVWRDFRAFGKESVKVVNLTLVKDSLTDSLLTAQPAKIASAESAETGEGAETAPENASPALDTARLLDTSRELLGEQVHGSPGQYPDAWLLLAWVAQVYHQRDRLRKPARVAYANLKAHRPPERAYLENPSAFLPDWFLGRVGLAPPEETQRVSDGFQPAPNLPMDRTTEFHGSCENRQVSNPLGLKSDPSLALPANLLGTRTASQAWEAALEQLRLELPVGIFRVYLLETRLARYDAEAGVFFAVAPEASTRDWLESHLAVKLERLLLGICDRSVAVRFVSARGAK